MVMVPAVVLGAFVVFALGYVLTSAILGKIAKKERRFPTLYQHTLPEVKQTGELTEHKIDIFAKIGGIIAVALAIVLLFVLPRQGATIIWIVLIVFGILVGIFTFLR